MQRAIYRIIDANFNRAREALRVMEDFCRFYLNSSPLSERCKKLRHDLSSALAMLDQGKLIANRNIVGDVGTKIQVEGQLVRGDLKDCAIAAGKRLTEALRTISESAQTLDKTVAKSIENVRYHAYTLEKDIIIAHNVAQKLFKLQFYAIITAEHPAEIIRLAHALCQGGADCIQLRAKNMPDDRLFACAVELVGICRNFNVISIINDRMDIAVAAESDGVHLGQNDLPIAAAKKLAASPMIFGASTHNLDELNAAIAAGADYVGIGPAFISVTKPHLQTAGIEYIKAASKIAKESGVATVAIGGITIDNVEEVLAAGADAIAVSSALTEAKDAADMCRAFKRKVTAYKEDRTK